MEPVKYLTFNPNLELVSSVSTSVNPADVATLAGSNLPDLPLERQWKIWEQLEVENSHDYANSMKLVASFSTVHGFWEIWNALPQPSQLMTDQRMVRNAEGGQQHPVDAIMIFRDDVEPMWEDPLNSQGGHYEIRYQQSSVIADQAQADEHWNNIVLGMIGATLEPEGVITGVRLVDKLHSNNRAAGNLRIEIWFTEKNFSSDAKHILKSNIEKLIVPKSGNPRDLKKFQISHRAHTKSRR